MANLNEHSSEDASRAAACREEVPRCEAVSSEGTGRCGTDMRCGVDAGYEIGVGRGSAHRVAARGEARSIALWVIASALAACSAAFVVAMGMRVDGFVHAGGAVASLAALALELLWESVEAGVVEEVLFRGLLLYVLVEGFSRVKRWATRPGFALVLAVLVSTIVFAGAHVASSLLASSAELDVAACLALALKFVQAFLFGLCMCALVLARRSLGWPILVHVAFDFLYFVPSFAFAGGLPASYAVLDVPTLVALIASILLLLPPCVKSVRVLRKAC